MIEQQELTWYLFFSLLDKGHEPTEDLLKDTVEAFIGYMNFKGE